MIGVISATEKGGVQGSGEMVCVGIEKVEGVA